MLWIALQSPDEAVSTLPLPPPEHTAPAPDLQALSWWALQFSPRVTVLEGAVLAEVQASERLFGGRRALLGHVRQACADLQVARMAVAPTALAARGLLRCMPHAVVPQLTVAVAACAQRQLSAVLDALPLAALLATQVHEPTLQRLGCERLGQLRALPRGGLSRRFGAALLGALDQAYGLQTELYPWVVLPEQFSQRLEFDARIEVAQGLMFGAHRLLGSLKAWLTARQSGVTGIRLHWEHDLQRRGDAKTGNLELRTGQATTDMQHLARLLAENLARTPLVAPVVAIRLQALEVEPLPTASTSLLPDDVESGGSMQQLLERLSARLGAQQVRTGQTVPDHRPQRMQAWAPSTLDGAARAGTATPAQRSTRAPTAAQKARATQAVPDHWAHYPCWILRQPLRLAVVKDKPIYQGPLQLLAGPERIETGWWPESASDSDLTPYSAPNAFPVRAEPVEAAFANPSTLRSFDKLRTGQAQDRPSSGRTDLSEQHGDLTLRDYFIASSEMAGLLWIYRQRTGLAHPGALGAAQVGWYLHGIYG
jgi:protein ImuB